jgi:fatty acid CoA ligase FadD32
MMNGAEPVRPSTLRAFNVAFAACGFRPDAWLPCLGIAENVVYVAGFPSAPTFLSFDRTQLAVGGSPVRPSCETAGTAEVECTGVVLRPSSMIGWEVRIIEPATHTALPDGTVGEIWVSGCCTAHGY